MENLTDSYFSFIIPGRPVPAARVKRFKKKVAFQAQRYLSFKDHVNKCAKEVFPEPIGSQFNIIVEIDTYFIPGGQLPDVDNLSKSIMDGLNGAAWEDDNQVIDLHIRRLYGRPQRSEIRLRCVPADGINDSSFRLEVVRVNE